MHKNSMSRQRLFRSALHVITVIFWIFQSPKINPVMKKTINFLVILFCLTFGFQPLTNAQRTTTWKGGTPGRPSDWYCSTNWKEGREPDEFSNVIIPDVSTSTFFYPVLRSGEVEILSLLIQPRASITISENARLIIIEQDKSTAVALKPLPPDSYLLTAAIEHPKAAKSRKCIRN